MTLNENELFAERLVRARAKAKLTQAELAKASELSWRQIAKLEAGGSRPRRSTLEKLAFALKCDPDYLSGRKKADTSSLYTTNDDSVSFAKLGEDGFDTYVIDDTAKSLLKALSVATGQTPGNILHYAIKDALSRLLADWYLANIDSEKLDESSARELRQKISELKDQIAELSQKIKNK